MSKEATVVQEVPWGVQEKQRLTDELTKLDADALWAAQMVAQAGTFARQRGGSFAKTLQRTGE